MRSPYETLDLTRIGEYVLVITLDRLDEANVINTQMDRAESSRPTVQR